MTLGGKSEAHHDHVLSSLFPLNSPVLYTIPKPTQRLNATHASSLLIPPYLCGIPSATQELAHRRNLRLVVPGRALFPRGKIPDHGGEFRRRQLVELLHRRQGRDGDVVVCVLEALGEVCRGRGGRGRGGEQGQQDARQQLDAVVAAQVRIVEFDGAAEVFEGEGERGQVRGLRRGCREVVQGCDVGVGLSWSALVSCRFWGEDIWEGGSSQGPRTLHAFGMMSSTSSAQ
jgi:hypothetical protein